MAKITWKSQVDIDRERLEEEALILENERKKAELEATPERVMALQEENMMLMMASAETYEQMYAENMTLMLAVAEMYEELQALKGGI